MYFLGENMLLESTHYCIIPFQKVFRGAMNWIEWDISARRRFVFDILKFIRLPLVPCKLLDAYLAECTDISLGVAITR